MSLVARLVDVERSDRVPVARPGTLRDTARMPVDVIVDNLSSTGCLLRLPEALPVGALVSLGIPGIGVHFARISRVKAPHHGCAFLVPISDEQIALALSVDTLVTGPFQPVPMPTPPDAVAIEDEGAAGRLSVRLRFAVIVGTSAAMWAMLIGAIILVGR